MWGTMNRANELAALIGLPLRELVVAPMVDQSELAFRMLCRRYGATLCYTPMLHARLFCEHAAYRHEYFTTCPADRPLFVQFCGNDRHLLLDAAARVQDDGDAIDLNLGCPQHIARRGRYGAFLLEEGELLAGIVSHLATHLHVPVTCKIRLLPTLARTLELARLLEASGCALLTVHGRTREQKGERSGACDWSAIRKIKEALSIPVIANGGVGTFAEGQRCREETGADAVMSSEALLENPAWVAGRTPLPTPVQMAREYLDMAECYPTPARCIRAHLFRFLHGMLNVHPDAQAYFADGSCRAGTTVFIAYLRKGLDILEQAHRPEESGTVTCTHPACHAQPPGRYYPWYDRHRQAHAALHMPAAGTVTGFPPLSRDDVWRRRQQRKARRAASR